jgi:hypothetical protein
MKLMKILWREYFSQTMLRFTLLTMLIVTSVESGGAEQPHEDFEYVCDTPEANVWYALLYDRVVGPLFFAEAPLRRTFIWTRQNCLLSHKLKTLKAKTKVHLFSNTTGHRPISVSGSTCSGC